MSTCQSGPTDSLSAPALKFAASRPRNGMGGCHLGSSAYVVLILVPTFYAASWSAVPPAPGLFLFLRRPWANRAPPLGTPRSLLPAVGEGRIIEKAGTHNQVLRQCLCVWNLPVVMRLGSTMPDLYLIPPARGVGDDGNRSQIPGPGAMETLRCMARSGQDLG